MRASAAAAGSLLFPAAQSNDCPAITSMLTMRASDAGMCFISAFTKQSAHTHQDRQAEPVQ